MQLKEKDNMVIETIAGITQQLMNFFIPELLFLLFVEKSGNRFKFRFSEIRDYPGLKPFANTWTVGIVAFIIYLFSSPIFEFLLGSTIERWLIHLNILKLVALTICLCGFTLIFFVNYLFEKNPDEKTIILGIIAIITFIIFVQ
jgi:hypothetical protein